LAWFLGLTLLLVAVESRIWLWGLSSRGAGRRRAPLHGSARCILRAGGRLLRFGGLHFCCAWGWRGWAPLSRAARLIRTTRRRH